MSERALRLLADVDRDRAQQLINEQIVRVKVGALLQRCMTWSNLEYYFLCSLSANHPTYGLTCQAVKHWRDTNLLSNHLNDDLIELTVAYLYAHSAPYTAPHCSVRAFHRCARLALYVRMDDTTNVQVVASHAHARLDIGAVDRRSKCRSESDRLQTASYAFREAEIDAATNDHYSSIR